MISRISTISQHHEVRRFVKFGLVGVLNTAIDLSVFFVLFRVFDVPYLIANIIAFPTGAINSYVLNRRWTFRSQSVSMGREMTKYFFVVGVGFFLNEGLLYLFVDHIHIQALLAKVMVTGLVLIWNFLANRLWTFRGSLPA